MLLNGPMRVCENFGRWFVPEVPDLFRQASWRGWCRNIGIARIVPVGRRWVKVKNRAHPAFSRVMDQFG